MDQRANSYTIRVACSNDAAAYLINSQIEETALSALCVALVITAAPAQADWLNAVKDGAGRALKESKTSAKAAA